MFSWRMSYSLLFVAGVTLCIFFVVGMAQALEPTERQSPLDSIRLCLANEYATLTYQGIECKATTDTWTNQCTTPADCCNSGEFLKITPTGLQCFPFSNKKSTATPSCTDCCGAGEFAAITTLGLSCVGGSCTSGSDCTSPSLRYCSGTTGRCAQCTENSHCSGSENYCNRNGKCEQCVLDTHYQCNQQKTKIVKHCRLSDGTITESTKVRTCPANGTCFDGECFCTLTQPGWNPIPACSALTTTSCGTAIPNQSGTCRFGYTRSCSTIGCSGTAPTRTCTGSGTYCSGEDICSNGTCEAPSSCATCITALGTYISNTVSRGGTWTSACSSTSRSGRNAKYYTFTLSTQKEITLDLSSTVDTYLYLHNHLSSHQCLVGSLVENNDDGGNGGDSRITRTLSPGTYTIEATTYSVGVVGSFTLTITSVAAPSYGPNSYGPNSYTPNSYTPPAYTPPAYTPPAYTPPSYTPPAYTPPAYTPPAYTPPAYTPPAYTPPAYTPPSYTPPAYTPPAYTPPAYTPPSYTPPAYTPPAYTPPAYTPPSYTPSCTHPGTCSSNTPFCGGGNKCLTCSDDGACRSYTATNSCSSNSDCVEEEDAETSSSASICTHRHSEIDGLLNLWLRCQARTHLHWNRGGRGCSHSDTCNPSCSQEGSLWCDGTNIVFNQTCNGVVTKTIASRCGSGGCWTVLNFPVCR